MSRLLSRVRSVIPRCPSCGGGSYGARHDRVEGKSSRKVICESCGEDILDAYNLVGPSPGLGALLVAVAAAGTVAFVGLAVTWLQVQAP
jgi:hypothetical protein